MINRALSPTRLTDDARSLGLSPEEPSICHFIERIQQSDVSNAFQIPSPLVDQRTNGVSYRVWPLPSCHVIKDLYLILGRSGFLAKPPDYCLRYWNGCFTLGCSFQKARAPLRLPLDTLLNRTEQRLNTTSCLASGLEGCN